MMTRYSYIIIDPLSSFGPGDRLQGVLSFFQPPPANGKHMFSLWMCPPFLLGSSAKDLLEAELLPVQRKVTAYQHVGP